MQGELFNPQLDMFDSRGDTPKPKPVVCLGMEFPDDEARRAHFTEELRKKLQDPEFRSIEGFPIGGDEDILNLSDPPYYTACPNPWIADFIAEWEAQKPRQPEGYAYHREPFAADVSEGKNDPIYNAHSYHTKVPHKAIMRYILHYTEPGDIVFDGFCGSGMTGVAAQMCGDRAMIEALNYRMAKDNVILQSEIVENTKTFCENFSKLGTRRTILSDLSPAATFITSNYADISSLATFLNEAIELVSEVEKDFDWLYKGVSKGYVSSAVWSDVFCCPNCGHEFVFWEIALTNKKIQESFACPHCGIMLGKAASKLTGTIKLERSFSTIFDPILKKTIRIPKLALVEETTKSGKKRTTRTVDGQARESLAARFEGRTWPHVPLDEFFHGRQTNKLINGSGISHICHMYTKRALFVYATLWQQQLSTHKNTALFRFCLSSINNYISRKQGYFGGGGGVSGTLFTPSLHLERNVFDVLKRKLKKLRLLATRKANMGCITTQSIVDMRTIPSGTVDYIFTDPPFGESLQYAELNILIEAWLKARTAIDQDCVLNYVHKKDLSFYSHMMLRAFKEYSRILKKGRWITIEFHNSQNAVWSAIQQAIESSGLVVADVRILDKQQRSFNAVNRSGAVDQDLVISAYKPNGGFEERFKIVAGTEEGVWDFLCAHLKQLPVFVSKGGQAMIVAERQNYLLFDRMVAFHVQRGVTVPLSAAEFYAGLAERFSERDGMYFLPEQVAEYDKKRMTVQAVLQLQIFVTDESSAIQWLRKQLLKKTQTTGELNPQFMQEIAGWQKNEKLLELDELLEQNFLCYDGKGPVPEQIHAYLSSNWKDLRNLPKDDPSLVAKACDRWYVPDPNKAGDLERLREKALLKEFDAYAQTTKKLKVFRLEAVRAGFKKAWHDRNYAIIVSVAEKIPATVLEEDPKLLMWYDQAITRMKGE